MMMKPQAFLLWREKMESSIGRPEHLLSQDPDQQNDYASVIKGRHVNIEP